MTPIWHQPFNLEFLNQRSLRTMSEFLGIVFTDIGDDFLTATMPVNEKTKQPIGILHGGANVVLAETIASTAANAVVDQAHQYCVGLEINANHLQSAREGIVTGIARPIHLGKTTQVWSIEIRNASGKLTCISRMTAAILNRKF